MIWRGAGGAVRGGSSDRVAASTGAGSREDIAALLERHQSARAGSAGQGRSGRGRGQKISIENILSSPGRRATRAASGRCGRGSPPSCRCPRRWRPPCPRSLRVHVSLARSEKTLKNLFLEKIIIPGQKSVPFYVIKEVQ